MFGYGGQSCAESRTLSRTGGSRGARTLRNGNADTERASSAPFLTRASKGADHSMEAHCAVGAMSHSQI